MKKPRFKIDATTMTSTPFKLFRRVRAQGLLFKYDDWETIDYFPTREAAREKYEQIKDLPEYLS